MCEECEADKASRAEAERQAQLLQYAWNWFSYHAEQRTNMFNYSLVAASLLAAGLATALGNEQWTVAGVLGVVGVIVTLSFWRIDHRNSTLVGHSEQVLVALEGTLFPTGEASLTGRGKDGEKPKLIGILREDDRQFKDRRPWKDLKSLPKWVTERLRDYRNGKHGLHLRWIELWICAMFAAAAVFAFWFPEALTVPKPKPDPATQVVESVDQVSKAIRALDARLVELSRPAPPATTPPVPPPPEPLPNTKP